MFEFFWTSGLQHLRLPCPSPSPGGNSNSHPLSWWCHPTISSSVTHLVLLPSIFPVSGSFPMSQLFASDGQSTGASASASVLPKTIQGWYLSGYQFDLLTVQGILKSLLQHQSSKAWILLWSAFFMQTIVHVDITKWSIPKSDWLYSLQPKMEKLYTVSKNKTGSGPWFRSWAPYCKIPAWLSPIICVLDCCCTDIWPPWPPYTLPSVVKLSLVFDIPKCRHKLSPFIFLLLLLLFSHQVMFNSLQPHEL